MTDTYAEREVGVTPVCPSSGAITRDSDPRDHEYILSSRALRHPEPPSACSTTKNIMPRGTGTYNAPANLLRYSSGSVSIAGPRPSTMIRARMQSVLQYWIPGLCITIVEINHRATSRETCGAREVLNNLVIFRRHDPEVTTPVRIA